MGFPDGLGGADGLEELFQNDVQPRGFALCRFQQFFHVRPVLRGQLFCLPGQELEMKADGVEGVAYFMGHPRGQQREGVQAFRLDVLRVFLLPGRFIPYQDQMALVPAADGGDENVQEFVLRIKNLHVPGNGGPALLDGVPGAVPAQEDAEVFRRDLAAFLVKELEGGLVDKQDFSLAVQQDQTFLDGFKHLLEKTLLFCQLYKETLEVLFLDMVNAADQLIDGVFLHGGVSVRARPYI